MNQHTEFGRRAFLKNSTLFLAAAGFDLLPTRSLLADDGPAKAGVKVGLITDLHYADKPPTGTRYYRETLDKLAKSAKQFEKVNFQPRLRT